MQIRHPLFPLGRLVATPAALAIISESDIEQALQRHAIGNWGELDADDKKANDLAVLNGTRLLSSYTACSGARFWLITEADRSATTILLPEDY